MVNCHIISNNAMRMDGFVTVRRYYINRMSLWLPDVTVTLGWVCDSKQLLQIPIWLSPWGPDVTMTSGWVCDSEQLLHKPIRMSRWHPDVTVTSGWVHEAIARYHKPIRMALWQLHTVTNPSICYSDIRTSQRVCDSKQLSQGHPDEFVIVSNCHTAIHMGLWQPASLSRTHPPLSQTHPPL